MGTFGGYYFGEKRKKKKKLLENQAKKQLDQKPFILPEVEIIGKRKKKG